MTRDHNAGDQYDVQRLEMRMQKAINACEAAITGRTESAGAFCIVLEGMFTNPEVELRVVGTVAEGDRSRSLASSSASSSDSPM